MIVGLGTGSTARFAVERLGNLMKEGKLQNIICIPTSEATKAQALTLDIPLSTLNEHSRLDVVIDGADDVDPSLSLIKGGGGALLREKMVEVCSDKFVCIVDESKLSKALGPAFPLPVEITPFCFEHTIRKIAQLPSLRGCNPVLRRGNVSNNKRDGENIAVTDNGNYIVDVSFPHPIFDASEVSKELLSIVGVVEHGLFVGMASVVIVAGAAGVRTASLTGEGERPWW